jgi:hypothetical protein
MGSSVVANSQHQIKKALTACRSLNFRIFLRPNAVSSGANGAAVVKANMTAGRYQSIDLRGRI